MNIKSILIKVRKIPNDLYNKFVFYYRKVKVGNNVNINGRIYCVASEENLIVLGNNVVINSSLKSNPIGGDTRTILYAGKGAKIQIGNNTGISNCAICAKENITIGENVLIGGGSKIYDTDFHWLDYYKRNSEGGGITSPVNIGDGVFIGANCIVLKGVRIGKRAIIGAGSVVTKDIPQDEVWAGNPARKIR
nr:acyltransferase [uncultured Mediterraneibacter sp.]